MGNLIINESALSAKEAEELVKICPFGAISYNDGKLSISSACKMCKCASKTAPVL